MPIANLVLRTGGYLNQLRFIAFLNPAYKFIHAASFGHLASANEVPHDAPVFIFQKLIVENANRRLAKSSLRNVADESADDRDRNEQKFQVKVNQKSP